MIKWLHPSTAPHDGSNFAVRTSSSDDLDNCMYEDGDFIISSIIAGPEKRRSAKLMGYIGWARWSDVFIHIRDTAHAVDTEEVTDARFNARITLNRLQAYMKWMPEDQKALALRAAETIERLLKLVPPGN